MLGGLLLGVVEAHSQWYFGPHIRDLVAYLVLFAFLVVRPGGVLGEVQAVETAAPQGT
jgi:branched-chain amino acid transport system permease protein